MPRALRLSLLAVLVLVAIQPVLAADQPPMTPEEIRAKCAEIDARCAAALQTVEELQVLKSQLLEQLGTPAAPSPPVKPSSWTDRLSLGGYFQTRYETFSADEGAPGSEDRFGLRRLFVNLKAKTGPRSSVVATWTSTGSDAKQTKANWTDVYGEYKAGRHDTLRFGQGVTCFGLELPQSSSARLPFERAALLEGASRGKPGGLYAGGRWDRGLWWTHTPRDNTVWPQMTLGVVNGAFRNDPLSNDRSVEASLKWKPRWGQYGLSWLNGGFQQPMDTASGKGTIVPCWGPGPFARSGWIGYVRYERPRSWALQSEYLGGLANSHSLRGWYGQLERSLPAVPGTGFARYEWLDPSTDTATTSDRYYAWVLGYAYQLDANNRVTAQGTWGRTGGKHLDETGLQWQCSY